MTKKSSQDSGSSLLQKYKQASSKVKSQKAVIKAYENIADISSAAEAIKNRQELLLIEQGYLVKIGEQIIVESTRKIKELKGMNRNLIEENIRLHSDFERLKLEYRRQIGVLPKAMNSKGKDETVSSSNEKNTTSTDVDNEKPKRKKRGAPKGHKGNTRVIPEKADVVKEVALPLQCDCGCTTIIATGDTDIKYIEDILPVCAHTTKIEYQKGCCSKCGSLVRHKDAIHGPPVSIGPHLSAHLVLLRQMGVTYRKLSHFTTETLGIPLSPSGVLGVVSRSAETLRPTYKEIFSAVRKQDVLNADETGWPIANKTGYIWGFFNKNLAFFHADKSRGSKVPKAILGENFKGTVLCDFYASYNFLAKKQRCWIHLLRDIEKERKVLPGSSALKKFETRAWDLVNRGIEISKLGYSPQKTKEIAWFARELLRISKMKLPDGKASTLAKRIGKHDKDLVRYLEEPGMEYHNNRAERQLRPLVVARKNSYGSNTPMGAERNCIIYSVIETCRLNQIKPVDWLKRVLALPHSVPPSPFSGK